MSKDLYQVLDVAKAASEEDIRSAYRRHAKATHPDLNPGNKVAEQRFKEYSAAYAILGDAERRKRYDAGEIDETGAERPERTFYRQYAEAEPGFKYERGGDASDYEDLGGIFSELFRRDRADGGTDAGARFRGKGQDIGYSLAIDFLEAVNGTRKRVDLPDGRTLNVTVPPGVADGQRLRLAGMGAPGIGGGPAGNAVMQISIKPHPVFRRDGTTVRSVLPITIKEALAGASVPADTVTGKVNIKVPKGSNSGNVLRLKGKGAADPRSSQRGDHLIELRIMLPEVGDAEFERIVTEWETQHPYNPREMMGGGS